MRFNAPACGRLYADLAPHACPELPPEADADMLVDAIMRLVADLGLPPRLREAGVPWDAIPRLAEDAMRQTRLLVNNPRPVALADARDIYEAAW
jgi:alcohol dehydrogenase class IV